MKIGEGGPTDEPEDLDDAELTVLWAGCVPIVESFGAPIPDDLCPPGTPLPHTSRRGGGSDGGSQQALALVGHSSR